MRTLHIISASSDRGAALANCLRGAAQGDTILLIGNGVFWASDTVFTRATANATNLLWCALTADVASRGIGDLLATEIQQIDDGAFVDLVISHHPIVSWS